MESYLGFSAIHDFHLYLAKWRLVWRKLTIGTLLHSTTTTTIIVIIHISNELRTSDWKKINRIINISLYLHQNLGYCTDILNIPQYVF